MGAIFVFRLGLGYCTTARARTGMLYKITALQLSPHTPSCCVDPDSVTCCAINTCADGTAGLCGKVLGMKDHIAWKERCLPSLACLFTVCDICSFFFLSAESLHWGGAECQTDQASAESCPATSQAGGTKEVTQSPGSTSCSIFSHWQEICSAVPENHVILTLSRMCKRRLYIQIFLITLLYFNRIVALPTDFVTLGATSQTCQELLEAFMIVQSKEIPL